MIANLFSRFDPTSRVANLPLNWLASILGLLFVPYIFWTLPGRWALLWNNIVLTLHKEFSILLTPKDKGRSIIFVGLFRFIVFNNFLGLLPYVFTRTRHLTITLTLALPFWASFILYGWLTRTEFIFSHLVPLGTPDALIPFIVLIETVRNIIRPRTLAVRLAANMIAGHLLLTLLGNTGNSLLLPLLSILIFAQILLLILEAAVAVIQAYVFAVLRTLYAREVN